MITQTWGGQRFSGHGDAFLGEEDVRQTAQVAHDSLEQLIRAASGGERSSDGGELEYFHQTVCRIAHLPDGAPLTKDERALLKPILAQVPIPTEGETGVSVPRFRIETGPFFSIGSGLRFGAATGGLSETEENVRAVNRLELLARVGLSTTGVLSNHSDGAMFVEFGYVLDGNQYNNPQLAVRDGQRFGMRMPYWLIPGDLLLIAPTLYFMKNMDTLQNVAIAASNGGLLGLQGKIETGIVSFQFMLGRQLAVSIYGYLWSDAPRITTEDGTTIGHYRSVETDIPIIEYQAARAFAEKLAFSFIIQFGYALEIPSSVNFVSELPGPTPTLSDSNTIYLRFSLEGIKY